MAYTIQQIVCCDCTKTSTQHLNKSFAPCPMPHAPSPIPNAPCPMPNNQ
ncbi:MAG: hypothetical protein PUQ00_06385 [Nostoc sp. S13]|nr:hypothetical protein [Nostoc sp. S13]